MTAIPKPKQGISDSERAIRQLTKLFARLRHTVPFPHTMIDVYKPLLPSIKLQKALAGGSDRASIMYQNLHLSIMWGKLVHVSLDPWDVYSKGISGEGTFDKVFHMTFKEEVIVPDIMTHPYRMDESHPHWSDVDQWVTRAAEFESAWHYQLSKLNSYLKRTGSAASIRQTWPELLNYVKLQGPTMAHVSRSTLKSIREQSSILQKPKLQRIVLENLAAAVMLENDREPDVWISFKTTNTA